MRYGAIFTDDRLTPNMALQRIGYRFDCPAKRRPSGFSLPGKWHVAKLHFPDITGSLRSASLTWSGPIAELERSAMLRAVP